MPCLYFKVLHGCLTAVHIVSRHWGGGKGDGVGRGGAVYCPIITHSTVLRSICILILYKSSACSMDLSEMDAQVYNKQGTSLCK